MTSTAKNGKPHGNVKELSVTTVRSKINQLHAFLTQGESSDADRISAIKSELHTMIDNWVARELRMRS